jgi:hypothetical protein
MMARVVELVTVTVALTVWASPSLQESVEVAVPPKVTLVGFKRQVAPPFWVTERSTMPVSPFWGVRVIVEVPIVPTFVVTTGGFMLMSMPGDVPGWTTAVTTVELAIAPLAPADMMTVTVYVPA